jgi:hypothetical protein
MVRPAIEEARREKAGSYQRGVPRVQMKKLSWHTQRLDDQPLMISGRAWFRMGDALIVNPEWHIRPNTAPSFSFHIHDELSLGIGVMLLGSFYLSLSGRMLRWTERILPGYWIEHGDTSYKYHNEAGPNRVKITEGREIRLRCDSTGVWWSWWVNPMVWSSSTPRWRQGSFHPKDVVLGKARFSQENNGESVVAMASFHEGSYPLILQRQTWTWKRSRWPWPKTARYVDIRVPEGAAAAGFQGKGENSWDCGSDAIYGMSSEGHDFYSAIGAYTLATLKKRGRYGCVKSEDSLIVKDRKVTRQTRDNVVGGSP